MIKQFRIDRFNGVEFLVLEAYNRHTWTKSEVDAYLAFMDAPGGIHVGISQDDFACLLNEWLSEEHDPQESFYGMREPIPVVESIPSVVVRGAIVNNKVASIVADFMASVTPLEVMDLIGKFFEFVRSPHWRNTIKCSIQRYGSLFGPEDDSQSS